MTLKERLKKCYDSIWAFVVVSILVLIGWKFDLTLYVVGILTVYCFVACMVCDELTPILFPVIPTRTCFSANAVARSPKDK